MDYTLPGIRGDSINELAILDLPEIGRLKTSGRIGYTQRSSSPDLSLPEPHSHRIVDAGQELAFPRNSRQVCWLVTEALGDVPGAFAPVSEWPFPGPSSASSHGRASSTWSGASFAGD